MPERGFVGVETSPGTPEIPFTSLTGEAQKLHEEPSSSPEGKVRERNAETRVRKTLFESLAKSKLRPVILALAVFSPRAIEEVKDVKAVKIALDDLSLKDVAAWEDRPKLEGLPSYEAMRGELAEAIGEEALENEIPVHTEDYVDDIREMRRKQEQSKEPLDVQGFEEKYGIPDASIRTLIAETMPAGWTGAGTVASLQRATEPIPFSEASGLRGNAAGLCQGGNWERPAKLFMGPDYKLSAETPVIIAHELAHASDWNRSNTLSPEDRLTLMYLVHERLSSPDRLHFPYVESINNPDKKAEHLKKCTEYWAELVGHALMIPAKRKEEWERRFRTMAAEQWSQLYTYPSPDTFGAKDLKLFNWYISRVDPSFKPWEAAEKRGDLISATMREAYERAAEERLARIPSPELRAALLSGLAGEDTLEQRLAELFVATSEGRNAPEEIRDYIGRFETAWSRKRPSFSGEVSDKLAFADHAIEALGKVLYAMSVQTWHLASVRESKLLADLDETMENAVRALRDCSPAEQTELARAAQKRADIQHGRIDFDEQPPKSLAAYVNRMRNKGYVL